MKNKIISIVMAGFLSFACTPATTQLMAQEPGIDDIKIISSADAVLYRGGFLDAIDQAPHLGMSPEIAANMALAQAYMFHISGNRWFSLYMFGRAHGFLSLVNN